MKYRLLDIVLCPHCQGQLACTSFLKTGAEVLEGILTCDCGRWYPIIGGVPRLLPDSLMADFLSNNSDFLEKYRDKIPQIIGATNIRDASINLKRRTSDSFGFEWDTFSDIVKEYEANFLSYINPIEESFFRDKLVLDAGCGAGRHSYFAAKYGAEVVAFDLSKAVEAAFRNTKRFPKLHVLQADIYNLPFRKEFDYIFCIGVLHHLPDPQQGFNKLVPLLKPGSPISTWVYGRKNNFLAIYIYELIRKITTRMPHKVLYYLCYVPAAIMETSNAIYKTLNRFRLTRHIAGVMPFKYYSSFPFRTKLNDSFDVFSAPSAKYYTEQEIQTWFKQAGLADIKVSPRTLNGVEKGIKGWGTRT